MIKFATNYVSPGGVNSDGTLATGAGYQNYGSYSVPGAPYQVGSSTAFLFNEYDYIAAGGVSAVSPLLATNAQFIFSGYQPPADTQANIGISDPDPSTSLYLPSGQKNSFGLAYQAIKRLYNDGTSLHTDTLAVGGSIPDTNSAPEYFYAQVTPPQLQTVGYYFGIAGLHYLPGHTAFNPTNASPELIAAVGQTVAVTAWARQRIVNGNSNRFGFLEQYFDQACLGDANNNFTTNQTGIVSEYGEFFPTEPGRNFLITQPDANGQRGTNAIDVIKLQLDGNHDGIMDPTFAGPDNTSVNNPFNFWVNNDYDRSVLDNDDNTYYEDSVLAAGCPYTPNQNTPDDNYQDAYGRRVIPTKRDLQDFTRLWIAGITTNLLTNLPSGSAITLSWGDVGSPNTNNPTIDLFVAADANGGIGYLTNETVASQQTNLNLCPYVARLGPGQSLQLNASAFSNHWAGNYFIWCGVGYGSGALTLTIVDGNSNVLAQSSQFIQLQDLKQLYERWTVGDAPSVAPASTARLATDNFPSGLFPTPFQYNQPTGTNTPYILYVHGWNLPSWEKDRFAESAFKRLYWQGYQGRFGIFRWPTSYHVSTGNTIVDDAALAAIYDPGEFNAWQSAQGLMNKLNDLNAEYPGHVYMLAHSMGNVVAGEALRKASQQELGKLVNTYVATQAAVPGHCYDSTLSGDDLLDFGPAGFYGPTTANIYNNWLATNTVAVGKRINFYNTNDYALNSAHWQLDEKIKPDSVIGIAPPYGYNGSPNDNPPLQNGFYSTYPPYVGPLQTVLYLGNANSVSNRYEITAFAAEPRSKAMGAVNISALARNVYLGTVWPSDTVHPLTPYDEHFWHSAEFRGDYWQQQSYWSELLSSDAFNLK